MVPPAPARFSTGNGWPRFSWKRADRSRPRMSVAPPGTNATTMRAGFTGYAGSAASAGGAASVTAIKGGRRKAEGGRILAANGATARILIPVSPRDVAGFALLIRETF